jgi:hypothetical protein
VLTIAFRIATRAASMSARSKAKKLREDPRIAHAKAIRALILGRALCTKNQTTTAAFTGFFEVTGGGSSFGNEDRI